MSTETVQGAAFRIGDSTPSAAAEAFDYPEHALPRASRARASALGVLLAVALIALATLAALLIASAVFDSGALS